jgi:subfamily B ATP-binding cassette protein MsbA
MKSFVRILSLLKSYWPYVLLAAFLNMLTVLFSIGSVGALIPILNLIFDTPGTDLSHAAEWKLALAELVESYKIKHGPSKTLQTTVFLTLCIFICKNLSRYGALYILAPVRNGIVAQLKKQLHDKWMFLSLRQHSALKKGDMLTRATADLNEIEWSMLKGMEGFVRDPLMILGTLMVLFTMSPTLTLLAIAIIPISGGLIATVGKSLKKSAKKAQEELGQNTSTLEEVLTNLPVIKAFVAERAMSDRYQESLKLWTKHMVSVFRKRDLSSPIAEVLGVSVLLIVLYLGGIEVVTGRSMTGGELIAFVVLFYQLIPAFKNVTNALYDIQKGNASAARVFEVLDLEEARNGHIVPNAQQWGEDISLKNVFFSYEDKVVLKDLDLLIPAGKTTAIVGPSGSGKTTLLYLLAGFAHPQRGSISLGNLNLKEAELKAYRKKLGWVPQQPLLFNTDFENNIALGSEHDKAKINQALEAAYCTEFTSQWAKGKPIGEGGASLSGGQRQRLSIARAFCVNPKLLLLDEATAALDNESEARVQQALEVLMKERTTVVVAHRLSTIKNADQIAYLEDGKVVELGTHLELIENGGKYAALVNLGNLNADS